MSLSSHFSPPFIALNLNLRKDMQGYKRRELHSHIATTTCLRIEWYRKEGTQHFIPFSFGCRCNIVNLPLYRVLLWEIDPLVSSLRSSLIPMAGSPIFSFVVDGIEGSSACKPYSPGDEYWSPEADKIGYYDSEERAEFYLKHESSLPVTYDCVFQFEETMDKRIVKIRRSRYDLLAMKYKGICRLYGDLCIVGRTALNRLNGYDGLLEDLPPFVNSVLQSLFWSMLNVKGKFEVWEAMKSTNERAPIDDFNTLHRRMDQLELMVMSCPHEAESSVPRRYRKYFEMQKTSLSALIHPVYTAYLNDFQRVRDICGVLRNPPDNLKEVQGQLEVHIIEMEAQMARFPTFNGMVHPS